MEGIFPSKFYMENERKISIDVFLVISKKNTLIQETRQEQFYWSSAWNTKRNTYLECATPAHCPLDVDLLALGDGGPGAELHEAVHVGAAVLVHECVHRQLVDIIRKLPREKNYCLLQPGGSQRDVVYLGWQIAPSYMIRSQKRGKGGVAGSQPMSTAVHIFCTSNTIFNLWLQRKWASHCSEARKPLFRRF